MANILALIVLIGTIAFITSIIMLFIKKYRKKGIILAIVSLVATFTAAGFSNHLDSVAAEELGFVNVTDYQEAKQQNITDPKEWQLFKAKQAIETEKQAKEQAAVDALKDEQERQEAATKAKQRRDEIAQREEQKRIKAEEKAERKRMEAAAKETAPQQKPTEQTAQSNSQPKPEKLNPKLDPAKNIKLIIDKLTAQNIPWQSNWHTICTVENYCSVTASTLRIQAIGGTVTILHSNEANSADYMQLCSNVLSALSGINQHQANEYTINAFRQASGSGNAKSKISSVDFTIRKGSDPRLVCDFFHATDAAMLSPNASDEAKGQPEEAVLPDDGPDVPMHDLDWSDLDKKK